jgi:hypothetical protein
MLNDPVLAMSATFYLEDQVMSGFASTMKRSVLIIAVSGFVAAVATSNASAGCHHDYDNSSSYQTPADDYQPSYQAPSYQAPSYQAPSYNYNQPSYQAPSYGNY